MISIFINRRQSLRFCFYLSGVLFLLASCTTKPVLPEYPADPAGELPVGEEFYLLTRPAAHMDLYKELLGVFLSVEDQGNSALLRTREGVFSGRFPHPGRENILMVSPSYPPLSAVIRGDYPALFLRSFFRNDPQWEKSSRFLYQGPSGLWADTTYRDTLLVATDSRRLAPLQTIQQGSRRNPVLPPFLAEWWRNGQPALMVYLPEFSETPLLEGLSPVPQGSVLDLVLLPADTAEEYSLDLRIRFPDQRSAKLWSLGLRVFLAGRLGLSASEEERALLETIDLRVTETTLRLNGWTMTPSGWGRFLSSLRG